MKVKIKSARFAASLLVLAGVISGAGAIAQTAAPAAAAAPEPDFTFAYNIGVVTDYRFRSISQTSFDPAVQGGFDFTHKNGFYAGVWASNIKWIKEYVGAKDGSLEIDLYLGYKGEISKDFTYDVGAITYQYPGNKAAEVAGFANANTTEIYGALTYGVFTAKYSYAVSDFIANANSSGSNYFEVAAAVDLGNGLTLTPHIGRQSVSNVPGSKGDYTDYSLALTKDFGNGVAVTGTLIGTDADDVFYGDVKGRKLGKNTVTLGVKYSF